MYLIPQGPLGAAVTAMISRSGVQFIAPSALHELYVERPTESAIVQVSGDQASLLSRYPRELAPTTLSIITNVPGLIYNSDWMMQNASLPRIDWMEMEGRLAKAGHTAFTPAAQEKKAGERRQPPTSVDALFGDEEVDDLGIDGTVDGGV